MTISIFRNTLLIILFLSLTNTILAEETLMIKIQGDDIDLQETDLSHLAVGESEIIYTKNGNELTMTRTEQGMEVLVDGEKIGSGSHMAECNLDVVVETDCENCEMELPEVMILAEVNGNDMDCSAKGVDIEKSWVSEDGKQHVFKRVRSHINGDISAQNGEEVRMIMIHKEVVETSEEN